MPIHRSLNQDFFSTWNPAMAYALGYFAADGSMYTTKRGTHFIDFVSTDRVLLVILQRAIDSNHHISTRKLQVGHKQLYRLQIGSKQWFSDLEKLGFTQAKSHNLPCLSIPQPYLAGFVRGYFDGDGNVYFKKHMRKETGKLRYVFTCRFTSGCKSFLEYLHHILKKQAGVSGGAIRTKERGCELVFGHRDSLALYGFMYNNVSHDLLLYRKYSLFSEAVRTLYPQYKMRVRA